jgi:hypothetical protein
LLRVLGLFVKGMHEVQRGPLGFSLSSWLSSSGSFRLVAASAASETT